MNTIYKKIFRVFNKNKIFTKEKFKKKKFNFFLRKLHNHHFKNSAEYKKIHSKIKKKNFFITADLFKQRKLKSIKDNLVWKKIISSGTTGEFSKIYLSKENAFAQSMVLKKILNFYFKKKYIIIFLENPNSKSYNAQIAAINGFSLIAKEKLFPFKNNELDLKIILNKIKQTNKNEEIIIFGFTNTIWSFFNKKTSFELKNKFKNITIIHGGGWKKLESKKVTRNIFINFLKKKFGINKIINYYGLVEQIGSIFLECKKGYFHTSSFSDIKILDKNLDIEKEKKKGIVQLISLLPTSYPGYSILTQDEGLIHGVDDCKCGLPGKYFEIYGRVKKAELRGCSNV